MGERITKDQAILRFQSVHGDRYDYSEMNYQGALKHITIRCLKHGYFSIIANNHRLGFGCKQCSKELKLKSLFDSFAEKHGGFYDYSCSTYIAIDKKIKILCPVHGEFERLPLSHLRGSGCFECQGKIRNTETLVAAFKRVHGETYDYSAVQYQKSNRKVKILCKKHGEFYQNIYKHLDYQGCPKCAGTQKKTNNIAIAEFNQVYGTRFDYSMVDYQGNNKKVIIVCREHGAFTQTPKSHLKRIGCEGCNGE